MERGGGGFFISSPTNSVKQIHHSFPIYLYINKLTFTFAGQAVSLSSKLLRASLLMWSVYWSSVGLFQDGTVLLSSHSHQSRCGLEAGDMG